MSKSILQEGSSLGMAVEKAWQQAGKPDNFSIKVISEGDTTFFGLIVKKPCVVSCVFVAPTTTGNAKSYSSSSNNSSGSYSHNRGQAQHSTAGQNARPVAGRNSEHSDRSSGAATRGKVAPERSRLERVEVGSKRNFEVSPAPAASTNGPQEKTHHRTNLGVNNGVVNQVEPEATVSDVNTEAWTQNDADTVRKLFVEMLSTLGISMNIDFAIDQQLLTLSLQGHVVEDPAMEKSFFVSSANLLMLMLRKQAAAAGNPPAGMRGLRLMIKVVE